MKSVLFPKQQDYRNKVWIYRDSSGIDPGRNESEPDVGEKPYNQDQWRFLCDSKGGGGSVFGRRTKADPGKYQDFVEIRSQSEGWKIG